jgi:hypothetical protein
VTEQVLDVPIWAVVGGLHLPVHAARTPLVPQAVLGNPHTPWQPISTPWTYDAFRRRFGRSLPHSASRRRTAA